MDDLSLFRPTPFPRIWIEELESLDNELDRGRGGGTSIVIELARNPGSYNLLSLTRDGLGIQAEDGFLRIIISIENGKDDALGLRKGVERVLNYIDKEKLCINGQGFKIRLIMPESYGKTEHYGAIAGLLSSLYTFTLKTGHSTMCEKRVVVYTPAPRAGEEALRIAEPIFRGVYIARDVANLPPNILNPDTILDVLNRLYDYHKVGGLKVGSIDFDELERRGFGGIVNVGKGSRHKPRLIEIMNTTAKNTGNTEYLLVGKTVVFDSGGLDLKTPQAMDEMKYDKSGGASVAGIMASLELAGVKRGVVGLLPVVENLPGPHSYKPRDVIKMYNGKTVEVTNTDAEGRLILADALSYGIEKYSPRRVIDLATLTGSVVVALGNLAAGLFSNNEDFARKIKKASRISGERLWELPLFEEYGDKLKSTVADLKNSGGRQGGASIAAWFLKQFVDERPWAHIDIAGTAWVGEDDKNGPLKGATGWGVETLTLMIMGGFNNKKQG